MKHLHAFRYMGHLLLTVCVLLTFAACQSDRGDLVTLSATSSRAEVLTQPFDDNGVEGGQRAVLNPTTGTVVFSWQENDALAIYAGGEGENGLTNFSIASINSENPAKAVFRANGFNLKAGNTYYAFYPYDALQTDRSNVVFDYCNQRQKDNGAYDHLGAKDFQYSTPAVAEGNTDAANLKVALNHLGCICRFTLSVSPAQTYTNLRLEVLCGDEHIGIATKCALCFSESPEVLPNTTSTLLDIALGEEDGKGISAEDGKLVVYAMLPPADWSAYLLRLTLTAQYGAQSCKISNTVAGKQMLAGKAYGYSAIVPGYVDLGLTYQDKPLLFAAQDFLANGIKSGGPFLQWPSEDPVTAQWGSNWRMPTLEEMQVLFEKNAAGYPCEWAATEEGVSVSNSTKGTTLYLPGQGNNSYYYWTSTANDATTACFCSWEKEGGEVTTSMGNLPKIMEAAIRPVYVGN